VTAPATAASNDIALAGRGRTNVRSVRQPAPRTGGAAAGKAGRAVREG
jgi:hypothetical protein